MLTFSCSAVYAKLMKLLIKPASKHASLIFIMPMNLGRNYRLEKSEYL